MRLRSIVMGISLLTAGTVIGGATQHFASAGVSSGTRAVLIPIEPCRVADTRSAPNTVGPRSVPLGPADTHTIDIQEPGTPCTGLIPVDASAVSLNVTALGATSQTFLTIWAGGARPLAASLNPAPGQPPAPNAVTTQLSTDQEFEIYNDTGSVSVVVDVNGYYVDHDHDDRYEPVVGSEIFVGSGDFVPSDPDFAYKDRIWIHEPASGRDCLVATLDIPAGTAVTSVDLRYNAATDIEIDVLVGGVSRTAVSAIPIEDYLDHNLYRDDQLLTAVGEDDIGSVNVVSGAPFAGIAIKPVAAEHDTVLELCSSSAVAIIGATVNLG